MFEVPMSERQRRLQVALRDDFNTYRFTPVNDRQAEAKLIALVKRVDAVFDAELVEMGVLVRDPKTGRIGKYAGARDGAAV